MVILCVPSDMPMCLPLVTIVNPTLVNNLTALSAETSVKSTSGRYLYLINSGIFCFFPYHLKVGHYCITDIFSGLFKAVSLAVAAGQSRAVRVISEFSFVYYYRVFHIFTLPYAPSSVHKSSEKIEGGCRVPLAP